MFVVSHVYYENDVNRQWTDMFFNTYEDARKQYRLFVKKYSYCFQQWVDLENLTDEITFTHKIHKIHLSITKVEEYRKPTEDEIELGREYVKGGDVSRGYAIMDSGLLSVEPIDPMWCMSGVACALDAEKTGFCKIIPINELPKQFPSLTYRWVDTPENRAKIEEYTKKVMEEHGHVPSEFRPFGRTERHYDLEPCPFCEGKAYLQRHYRSYVNKQSTNAAYVRCIKCNARGPKFNLQDYGTSRNYSVEAELRAVSAWNTRPGNSK